jgi:hypothetical protein
LNRALPPQRTGGNAKVLVETLSNSFVHGLLVSLVNTKKNDPDLGRASKVNASALA